MKKTLRLPQINRRTFLATAAFSTAALSTSLFDPNRGSLLPAFANSEQKIRLGSLRLLSALAVLQNSGALEDRLSSEGYEVQWVEFSAGPQQLEALNGGGLDLAFTAESPPIFAQVGGIPLVYLVATAPSGRSIALIVPKDSPIQSVADLKGKSVAVQKASIGHYLLAKALGRENLSLQDINPAFLPPPDANVAFSQAQVDAWFIWEPWVTRNVTQDLGRVLIDGDGLRDTNNFVSTSEDFLANHPEALTLFLEEIIEQDQWAATHPDELSERLAPIIGLDVDILRVMHEKTSWGLLPINEDIINVQQRTADFWFDQGEIPRQVNVREYFLDAAQYQAIYPASLVG